MTSTLTVVSSNDGVTRTPKQGNLSLVTGSFTASASDDNPDQTQTNLENDPPRPPNQVFKSLTLYLSQNHPPLSHIIQESGSEFDGYPYQLFNADATPIFGKQREAPLSGIQGLYLVRIFDPKTQDVVIETLYRTKDGEAEAVAQKYPGQTAKFFPKTGEMDTFYSDMKKICESLPIRAAFSFDF